MKAQWDGPRGREGREGPGRRRPSARRPPVRPLVKAAPLAASPGGTQAANNEAGFGVRHFIGWGDISSGCSTGSHTTFHASPRSRLWTGPETYIYTYIHPVAVPLPATPPRARGPRHFKPTYSHVARRAAQRLHPSSLIPLPPRRPPSIHLLLPTGECSGPTGTGAQSPPPPTPGEACP